MEKLTVAFLFVFVVQSVRAEEPHCSKYDFEEKVLEKMVRMEFKMERQKVELSEALQAIVDASNTVDAKIREFDKLMQERLPTLKLAFRAVQKSDVAVETGDTIVFSEVLHNDGGYDPNSGIFTATVNGTYIFTVRLCPNYNKYVDFSFKVDNTEQDVIVFYGDGGHSCYSAETVVVLKREQKVWLYVKMASSGAVIDGDSDRWNTFAERLPALKFAFKAVKKSNTDVRTGDTIVFPEVLHNDGGYDPNSGIFTASVNGTYIFTVRLCPYYQKYVQFSLKVDDTEQDAITFYGQAGDTCYSAETVVVLKREQKVWLYVKYAYSDSRITGDAFRWNAFTGLVF